MLKMMRIEQENILPWQPYKGDLLDLINDII